MRKPSADPYRCAQSAVAVRAAPYSRVIVLHSTCRHWTASTLQVDAMEVAICKRCASPRRHRLADASTTNRRLKRRTLARTRASRHQSPRHPLRAIYLSIQYLYSILLSTCRLQKLQYRSSRRTVQFELATLRYFVLYFCNREQYSKDRYCTVPI